MAKRMLNAIRKLVRTNSHENMMLQRVKSLRFKFLEVFKKVNICK